MRGRLSSTLRRLAPLGACAVLCLLVANCANSGGVDARYGVSPSARLVEPGEQVPKGGGVYRVGSPYVVGGRVYVPQEDPNYNAVGLASWYGADFHGRCHRKRRDFRRRLHIRRTSDLAAAELCAGDEPEQRPLADRPRQ